MTLKMLSIYVLKRCIDVAIRGETFSEKSGTRMASILVLGLFEVG